MKLTSKAKAEALESVLEEVRSLSRRLRSIAGETQGIEGVTAGMHSVLAELARSGPRTVPQMARSRSVSRQHIRTVVNKLEAGELVEAVPNPAHKRSSLVRVTTKGRRLLHEMEHRGQELLRRLPVAVSKKELRITAATLRSLGELFAGEDWKNSRLGD